MVVSATVLLLLAALGLALALILTRKSLLHLQWVIIKDNKIKDFEETRPPSAVNVAHLKNYVLNQIPLMPQKYLFLFMMMMSDTGRFSVISNNLLLII